MKNIKSLVKLENKEKLATEKSRRVVQIKRDASYSQKEIQQAQEILRVDGANLELYEVIDAYNTKMIELSPLNTSFYSSLEKSVSHEDLQIQRAQVQIAYRVLTTKVNNPKKVRSNDRKSPTIRNNEGLSTYDLYLNMFKRLDERLESINPKDCGIALTKKVNFHIAELNDTYKNPRVEELRAMRERRLEELTIMQERGFKRQRKEYIKLPCAEHEVLTLDSCHMRQNDLETKEFPLIFLDTAIKRHDSEKNKGKLYGVLKLDLPRKLPKKKPKRVNSYIIGRKLSSQVPKTDKELEAQTRDIRYKKVFGFDSPSYDDMLRFLKRIHNFRGDYFLDRVSNEELTYPLTDEVFKIYCAAEDSKMFEKLEFLIPVKSVRTVKDPILNGKILGSKNLPICWWV